MAEERTLYPNWQSLCESGYFRQLPDGRLELIAPDVDGIIDFHTHLGWTVLLAKKVDLLKRHPETLHDFNRKLKVDLSVYSGVNFYNERPKWGSEDYVPAAISPFTNGIHHTHTVPNIVWDMDPLKIRKSVILSLDIKLGPILSDNNYRFGEAIRKGAPDRLVFFCTVHPRHPRREKVIEDSLAMGAMGMKIHPEMLLMSMQAPEMISLLKLWNKISGGKPVLFHSGFNGFEPKKAREHAAIETYHSAVAALEGGIAVLGHSAMNQYRTAIEICEKYPHCHLELSGQPKSHLREMLDRLGPDRLLYGSDWPVYPQAIPITKILMATEDCREYRKKLLYDNAAKLLSLT